MQSGNIVILLSVDIVMLSLHWIASRRNYGCHIVDYSYHGYCYGVAHGESSQRVRVCFCFCFWNGSPSRGQTDVSSSHDDSTSSFCSTSQYGAWMNLILLWRYIKNAFKRWPDHFDREICASSVTVGLPLYFYDCWDCASPVISFYACAAGHGLSDGRLGKTT